MQESQANGHRSGVIKDESRTVFVRNLPFKASEADIMDFFSQVGTVEEVRRQSDDEGILPSTISCASMQACLNVLSVHQVQRQTPCHVKLCKAQLAVAARQWLFRAVIMCKWA